MSSGFQNYILKLKKNLKRKFKYVNLLNSSLKFPENKFVIYTRGRTGSTVLTDLINCHPDIFCDVEIFNFIYSNNKVAFPLKYIDSCSKRASIYGKTVYGFKVKISQLSIEHKYSDYEQILSELNRKNWKFIYLKRENYLRHKLSNLLITETNVYHLKENDEPYKKKIKVDCDLLMKAIKFGEEVEMLEKRSLKNIPYLEIIYEKDLFDKSNHQETANRIFEYLGLKTCNVYTDYKKVTPDNLEDSILNFEELYNYFKNTEYIEYLK